MSNKFPIKGEIYPLSHTYNIWFHKTNDEIGVQVVILTPFFQ